MGGALGGAAPMAPGGPRRPPGPPGAPRAPPVPPPRPARKNRKRYRPPPRPPRAPPGPPGPGAAAGGGGGRMGPGGVPGVGVSPGIGGDSRVPTGLGHSGPVEFAGFWGSGLLFAPVPVLPLGTGPGLSRGPRRSRGIVTGGGQIPPNSGWRGVEPSGFLGEEKIRSRWIPGERGSDPCEQRVGSRAQSGRGADPGGFPAGSLLCSLSHRCACSSLSTRFPGSQLIPRDGCSLAAGQGLIPDGERHQNHRLWDAEGLIPQGSHPGVCSGLTGVSPEWDPGWESILAGILGNGRFAHGDRMRENLRVWVILRSLLAPQTGAAAVTFPCPLGLRWVGVSSWAGTTHPLHLVFFCEDKLE